MIDEAITVERRVAAAPEHVYRYLTDEAWWSRWQGIGTTLEAAPGGDLRIRMGDGNVACGRFVDLVPNRRVVFTWGWQDAAYGVAPGSSTVAIDLLPDGDGTLVRLTHSGLPPAAREPHLGGWERYVGRLAACAEDREPGPDPMAAGG
jgi:uncharacterized protein YndB with AHSA1/START domain